MVRLYVGCLKKTHTKTSLTSKMQLQLPSAKGVLTWFITRMNLQTRFYRNWCHRINVTFSFA